MSFFDLLNIPPEFELDIAALEVAYFKAQRQFHPDRFVGKPAAEKLAAMQKSMDINQAYETLKNPLKRAEYLLSLQGIMVGTNSDTVKPSAEILMEVMELRENEANADEVKELIASSNALIADYFKAKNFAAMAQETLRLGYLRKMVE